MLFNSTTFFVFLIIVFAVYWKTVNYKNETGKLVLLISSYIFYGWWDWRFLSLIFISSIVDYAIGLKLFREEVPWKRKLLLMTSLAINLGFLGFFKYWNSIPSFSASVTSISVAGICSLVLR